MQESARLGPGGRLYYRVKEIAELTGLGLRTVAAHVASGEIPSRKIGDARLIPAAWLLAHSDHEAEDIKQQVARRGSRYSPKNQYSLGKSPRDPRGFLRLLRIIDSHDLRTPAAA